MTVPTSKPKFPRRMRSARLTLAIMGAGVAASLAGCDSPETSQQRSSAISDMRFSEPESYRNVDECIAGNVFTEEACKETYAKAIEDAPRFETLAACEEAHGEGACGTPPSTAEGAQANGSGTQASSGGGWFMPAMMGYMVGNMLATSNDGSSSRRVYQEPVYRTRENRGDWNAASASTAANVKQRNQRVASSFTSNSTTRTATSTQQASTQQASTQRATTQRSGFGSTSSARGGFGS